MAERLSYTDARFPPNVSVISVPTPQATVAAFVSNPPAAAAAERALDLPTLLLIHGNSASSLIFHHFFTCPLAQTHQIIAFDLPGHGESSNASEAIGPERVYTQTAYAHVALAVVRHIRGPCDLVVLGWSLGGHVGIEMCDLLAAEVDDATTTTTPAAAIHIRALILTGTPPVPRAAIAPGFRPSPHVATIWKGPLTESEIDALAADQVSRAHEPWMRDAVARTHGAAREVMIAAFRDGSGACEQRGCVERLTRRPDDAVEGGKRAGTVVAVINGAEEPYIDTRWIRDEVRWGPGLWRGQCIELAGAGHTPFWEAWDAYWLLLRDLMRDVAGG